MHASLRLALISAAAAALCACATAPGAGPSDSAASIAAAAAADARPSSAYGYYLAAQAALDAGDSKGAAVLFDRAMAADPDAGFISERAFTTALLSGDIGRAAELAPAPGEASPAAQSLGALAKAVEALSDGRGREAYEILSSSNLPNAAPNALLKPWAAAAAGKTSASFILPANGDRLTRMVGQLDQAMLYEKAGRYAEAETGFKALLADRSAEGLVTPAYGLFLERRGRRSEAVAVYDRLLAAEPDSVSVRAARARALAKGTPPPPLTVREGAAQALMAPAAAALADRQSDAGLVYLRLIVRLDPKRDDAWMLAGDVMSAAGDVQAGRDAYMRVPQSSARYADARSRIAWSYQSADKDQALKIARETAQQLPASDAAKLTLADLLRADQQYEESAQVLGPVIAAAGARPDWRLYYMRAVALERSGHWPEAQKDLDEALKLKPDQPEVLNYLGYSWVNRGEKVKQGLDLIKKAVEAQPQEGAYVDSLGWAYYRLGDYANAVQMLERAASLEAGDAEINDHLGDAYWRVGRRDEARFQWKAVLTLDPDPQVKARAEAKLASPLGPDAVVPAPTVASK